MSHASLRLSVLISIISCLAIPYANAECQSQSGIDGLKDLLKSAPQQLTFDSGTEAYILQKVELANCEFAFLLHFLNGGNDGPEFWVLESEIDKHFYHFNTTDAISEQTLKIPDSDFLKAYEPFTAYINYKKITDFLSEHNQGMDLQDRCFKGLVTLGEYYPVSNSNTEKKIVTPQNALPRKPRELRCPEVPAQGREGDDCPRSPSVNLSQASKLVGYFKNAEKESGVPASFLAALVSQESGFNPFAENEVEKKYCKNPDPKVICPKYKWSKGMVQMGKPIAESYGLDWDQEMPKITACESKKINEEIVTHYRSDACMGALEELCDKTCTGQDSTSKCPIYCPKQSLVAMGKYIFDILNRERIVHVRFKGSKRVPPRDDYVDISYIKNKSVANQFRYVSADYNRGGRVPNSIREYLQQHKKLPRDFDDAWTTQRKLETPTQNIGFRLLNGEYINRCYVWSIVGLCGEVPGDSLAGRYKKYFDGGPRAKKR